jgi:hypothetical protein
MLDGYKLSLSYVNNLTWSILSLSFVLLFLDPTAEKVSILGINFSQEGVTYIGPLVLIGLILTRQIIIANAAEIVRPNRSNADLKKLTKSYPLLEFIRWRAASKWESILISAFHGMFIEYLPLYVTIITFLKINQPDWIRLVAALIFGILIGILVQWNYNTLRKKVYEPLCGKIKTPD